jgi:LysR family transcriptional regulator, glycine cleavage system transcriptional activator
MRQSACDDRPLGQGVALANEMLVEDDLNSGALIEVVPSDIRLCGYYFVAAAPRWDEPTIVALRAWLHELSIWAEGTGV